ncbi:MAG TPA: hypothetical protein DDZ51_10690 [Planctomycetaceae bacterium]|nr:hypothetical protein [Planctomycetaceae bacterium]
MNTTERNSMTPYTIAANYGRELHADSEPPTPPELTSADTAAAVAIELLERQATAMSEIESFELNVSESSSTDNLVSLAEHLILERTTAYFVQRALLELGVDCPSVAVWDGELLARRDLLADFVAADELEINDDDATPWFLDPDFWHEVNVIEPPDLASPARFWDSLGVSRFAGTVSLKEPPLPVLPIDIVFYSIAAAPQVGNPEHLPVVFRHPLSKDEIRVYIPRRGDPDGKVLVRAWFVAAPKRKTDRFGAAANAGDLVWLDAGMETAARSQATLVETQVADTVRLEAMLTWQLDPSSNVSIQPEAFRLFINGQPWLPVTSDDI